MSALSAEQRYAASVAAFFIACQVFGGASAAGVLANLLLQIAAIGMLVWGVDRVRQSRIEPMAAAGLGLLGLVMLLPLVQIIPLPASLWTAMPGRAPIVAAYIELRVALPALGISLSPSATLASWLALLPAAAMFVTVLTLGAEYRARIGMVVVGVALVSLVFGLMQVAGGTGSALYFYTITSGGSAVGFFSNRNHLATLFLIAIPFVTLALPLAGARALPRASMLGRRAVLVALLALLCVGILLTGSRAGIALILPTVVLTYATMLRTSRGVSPWALLIGAAGLGTLVLAGLLYGPFYQRILARSAAIEDDVRFFAAPVVAHTGWDNFPFGTGFGTFDPVFRMVGGAANLQPNFVNHAHNDYLELWLTGGLPALLILLLFGWWMLRMVSLNWRTRSGNPSAVSRVAAIAVIVVLIHSFVDYPLRTAAISALFAMACALQLAPCAPLGRSVPGGSPLPFRANSKPMPIRLRPSAARKK